MDDRYIGRFTEDGGIATYPAVDLSGLAYEFPPTICGIGSGCFVVMPVSGAWSEQVSAARDFISPKGKAEFTPHTTNDAPEQAKKRKTVMDEGKE